MTKIEEMLTDMSQRLDFCFDPNEDYYEQKVRNYNNSTGSLEGYDCPECRNRGDFMYMDGKYERYRRCKCMQIRSSLFKLSKIGLKDASKRFTFDNFSTKEKWQAILKQAAVEFSENPQGWFFVGGQAGSGKSHLCTAIVTKLIYSGMTVEYAPWRDIIQKLKANIIDDAKYAQLMEPLKNAHVLYIDDFLKACNFSPTQSDLNIAYEIISYRYNNSKLITIISSESNLCEISKLDEATGSRIYERARKHYFPLANNDDKNQRLK